MGIHVLIFALFAANGSVLIDGQLFETKAECENARSKLVAFVAGHNASNPTAAGIPHYAAVCTETEKAPQGKVV